MSTESVQAIIFDLGKVIVDFDHHTISKKLTHFSPYPEAAIFDAIFSSGLVQQFDCGQLQPEVFFAILKQQLRLTLSLPEFQSIWNTIFSIKQGMIPLIDALATTYTLIGLSNTNVWHFTYCREHFPVLDRFTAWILSYEVGISKPDPRIYRCAVEAAGVQPHQCLYIDDVYEFIVAGESVGLQGIHFVSVAELVHQLKNYGVSVSRFF